MTPNPEKLTENIKKYSRVFAENDDNEIVISGMSGRFPNSKSVAEYEYHLYNKIDMVDDAESRWKHFNAEIPKRCGKLYELEKFDAEFFGIDYKQAHTMDPQCRILVEAAYETIIDAGINPISLRGSKTACFVGACISESEKTWFYEKMSSEGYGITGCSRTMLANRLSNVFGLHGPSCLVDTACSSSMYALDCAFSALRSGEVDAALVAGANLSLHPYVTLQFSRLGVLAKDGYCRPFDHKATGYTRAEAVNCLFLQRKKDAKRIYATLVYSKTNCDGHKAEGITYPSGIMQEKLLHEFYRDCNVSPSQLAYLEAHSTGTIVGDPEECRAIDNVLCKGRTEPLLVGSVKSNIGHSESASGICSLVKVILAFQNSKIPPNINFESIRDTIPALAEGRLKVVSEVEELHGSYIGVNSFGFGGGNAHALLKAHAKQKINHGIPDDDLSRLVVWAGRTEEAVNTIFDAIDGKPLDVEFITLLNNIQKEPTDRCIYRGFCLFAKDKNGIAKCLSKHLRPFSAIKRSTVWIFSGIGSQWCQMGSSLMNIAIFEKSIRNCHNILKSKDIDLINILTNSDSKVFDNPLHLFVGIASIQIALIDLLKILKIEPDYIIGHSVGELACGYADGGLTVEQTLLIAYYYGKVTVEAENIKGGMATINLGANKIRKLLPESIEIVWHNSRDSCTISGPKNEIAKLVSILTEQGILAEEVCSANIPYHSKYVSHLGPKLLKYLKGVITTPVKRSEKWLSTSVPNSHWNKIESQFCSAEYYTNNILSNVLFEETVIFLPVNPITIEVSPQCILQSILKKSFPNTEHIRLMEKDNLETADFLMIALGRIFECGLHMPIEELYPKIQYPVSRSTPSICSLIKWNHTQDWFITKFENIKLEQSGERIFQVNLQFEDEEYVSGHVIDGKILVPATRYLQMVWELFSLMYKGPVFLDMPVEFEDVRFLRATHLTKENPVFLAVMINGTGKFEITEGGSVVVTGIIREIVDPKPPKKLPPSEATKFPILQTKDFYKELRLRGYHYNGGFRAVQEARGDGLCGKVKWNNNWVTFMDCLLQIHILGTDSRTLCLPTRIRKLKIFGKYHVSLINDTEDPVFDVTLSRKFERLVAGGIEIIGLHASPVQRRKPPGIPVLEKYQFVSHFPSPKLTISDAIRCCVQLTLENALILKLKVVEVDLDNSSPVISNFSEAIEDLPVVSGEYLLLTKQEITLPSVTIDTGKLSAQTGCSFIISKNILQNSEFITTAEKCLSETGYLICIENLENFESIQIPSGFQKIALFLCEDESIFMLQKLKKPSNSAITVIEISFNDKQYLWLSQVQKMMSKGPIVLYSFNEKYNGLLGMVNCLRKEPDGTSVSCVFVDDPNAPKFDIDNPFYKNQLKLGLAINIYKNGKWGTYRHLQILPDIEKKSMQKHIYGNLTQRGDLSTLNWFEGPLDPDNCYIKIVYSSLNFRDIMLATGRLAIEIYGEGRLDQMCVLGFEFCGIESKTNRRVMGMIEKGGCSTFLTTKPVLMWEVASQWTLAEAATVPCVYVTVYYAFFFSTRVESGKSILIHAGTGGIGLAAIRVALAYGLDVFTTVSTPQKRKFLLDTFPQLKDSHIGQSRDTSFEFMIRNETKGKGVDFVLNSLSEDKLFASIRCLARGGHFLEIGKFDMANNSLMGLGEFKDTLSFHSVLADNLFDADHLLLFSLKSMIDRDMHQGIVKPLPPHIFNAEEIEHAFRFLASAKHMGKVLLKVREEDSELSLPVKVIPQKYFKAELVYVIPGGLGGFGLELADWLAIRGAKKLVLSSSRGITKSYQSYRIALWETYGCTTIVNTDDITTRDGCEKLLKEAANLGEIGGIFNLAVALRDAIFINQTIEKFIESFGPKAIATEYLDELSRKLCPKLEHFVIFSSVSCGRGNAGQTNYGMANSIMEKIIEDRVANGYPGKAIQWGAVGEVGLVADMAEDKIDMEIGGTLQQRISSCLQELDNLLSTPDPVVSSMVVAEKRAGRSGNENIIQTVMNIMGIRDLKTVSMGASLSEMGMDSLMAVEIKQTLERDFELFLTPQDLRSLTFQKLQEYSDAREKDIIDLANGKLKINDAPKGMQLLLRTLGDETYAHETLLELTTNIKNENNFNPSIILPGLEGVAGKAWYDIGKNLCSKSYILQLCESRDILDVNEIANIYIEKVKAVLNKSEEFYLVGYSFGALITLELVKLLEKDGYTGQVLLIDGAPTFLKKLVFAHLGNDFTNEYLADIFLTGAVAQSFPDESRELLALEFAKCTTIEEKFNKYLEYSSKQDVYSKEYAYSITLAMFNRISLLNKLVVDEFNKINAPITLVRSSEVSVVDIDEDYELSKIANGKVTLKYIEGNHTTMLDNPSLLTIINECSPMKCHSINDSSNAETEK